MEVIINTPNSRLVLLCADEDDDLLVVKLSTISGSILWEEKDLTVTMPASNFVFPAFDNEGSYLVVYLNAKVTVVNVRTGTIKFSFSLGEVIPTAIAITRDAKSIGITTNSKVHPTDVNDGFYKLRIPEGKDTHTFHCIVSLTEPDVKLRYLANGRRLYVSSTNNRDGWKGKYGSGALTWGYDVSSRTMVSVFDNGPVWHFRRVYLHGITIGNEEFHVVQVWKRGGDESVFRVFTGGGENKGEFSCGRGCIGFVDDGLVCLNDKYEVKYWSPGKDEAVKVAALEGIEPPVLESVKGIVLGESRIILVQDDGRFVVYGHDST
jgi:hypothetical protein